MVTHAPDLQALLQQHWHLDTFRPGQERIIRALLDGRDVLAILPTGAGKSLCYQFVAPLLPGITVVVSPLLALMRDQVEALEARGIEVGIINSRLGAADARAELEQIRSGEARLLYVTPERFSNARFMAQITKLDVSLFVIDEAHCVSEWGHSFRPAYLTLADAVQRLGRPTVLALTATATPWIRAEIVERLRLRDPAIVVHGTDRPRLFLEVRRVEDEADDRRVLRELLVDRPTDPDADALDQQRHAAMDGAGIIYTATTKAARETAAWLNEWGISADYYHGQRKKSDRERVQTAFMDGTTRVIVATNAFGLGIDKPDVRFVIHRDVPGSVEAYYQEAGRAGRDGEFARCVLIYRPADLGRAAFLTGSGELTRDEVRQARQGLIERREAQFNELEGITGLHAADLARLIEVLKRHKILRQYRNGRIKLLVDDFDPDAIALDDEAARRNYERSRLEMMRGYAELADCRRRYVLNYFGEETDRERCNMCDNDRPEAQTQRIEIAPTQAIASPFTIGARVVHQTLGPGVVQRTTTDSVTVLFEQVGYKTLATDIVQEHDLLTLES